MALNSQEKSKQLQNEELEALAGEGLGDLVKKISCKIGVLSLAPLAILTANPNVAASAGLAYECDEVLFHEPDGNYYPSTICECDSELDGVEEFESEFMAPAPLPLPAPEASEEAEPAEMKTPELEPAEEADSVDEYSNVEETINDTAETLEDGTDDVNLQF